MKLIFLTALTLTTAALSTPTRAQAPGAKDDQQVAALAREVRAQQGQIADNQAKIEAKLADLSETIRVARIFASRAK